MMKLPRESKWMLIQQRKKEREEERTKPAEYIHLLKGVPTVKMLESLVISLKGESAKWTRQFIQLGGVHLLVNNVIKKNLYVAELTTKEKNVITQAVFCLKGLSSTPVCLIIFAILVIAQ